MNGEDAYDRGARDVLELVRQVADIAPAALMLGAGRPPTMRRLADILASVDPQALQVLRPFDRREAIDVAVAAEIAGRSESCLRGWAQRYRIGRHVVGSLLVSRPALAMLLDDAPVALASYLSGDRSSTMVTSYFRRSA